ncbi:TetR family transcriptional regulator [Sphaerisporangium rubeum]|uniref:AcrR family transcriptional regulator n=1 Tax=Sphaerisporangium rubeum TaxID=321317 RepID=A0A7X0I9G2_9ACTN|nr:AcrR family transcriptional regulator [Sphaerisporangium rubeum]
MGSRDTATDTVRERILSTAGELFYAGGICATGVDRLSEAAGVSKRSLYQRFGGKDALIAEYLSASGTAVTGRLLPPEDDATPPRDRVLALFTTLCERSREPGFRGCPMLNAAAELPDPAHPARVVALEQKLRMRDFFSRQAAAMGAEDPGSLADQLLMLFDGAMSYVLVRATPVPESVVTAARALLDAQT